MDDPRWHPDADPQEEGRRMIARARRAAGRRTAAAVAGPIAALLATARLLARGAALVLPAAASLLPVGAGIPEAVAVPVDVLRTDRARVARLVIEPGAATAMHTHADPHLAVALVDGTLASLAADGAATPRAMPEGRLGYVPPGLTHALRNDGPATFRAATIDLLRAQTGARNRCAAVLPGPAGDCPKPPAKPKRAWLAPQMETDQTLVSLLTLPPGTEHLFKGTATPPLVVALAGAEATAVIEVRMAGSAVGKGDKPLREGDAATGLAQSSLTLRNTGTLPARFLVVEFR